MDLCIVQLQTLAYFALLSYSYHPVLICQENRIVTQILLALQPMDPDAFDCQTAMYCNHYPSWERKAYKEGTLRRIAHTDFEVLTLLFQRQGIGQPTPCTSVLSPFAIDCVLLLAAFHWVWQFCKANCPAF